MDVCCDQCEQSFQTRKDLLAHNVDCRKNVCENCEKEFYDKYTLARHLKKCTPNPSLLKARAELLKARELIDELRSENEKLKEENVELCNDGLVNISLNQQIRVLKKKNHRLKLIEKELKLYKNMSKTKSSGKRKLSKIPTDPAFICTSEGVDERMKRGDYVLSSGYETFIKFVTSLLIKDGAKCYVRIDNTRLNFHKWNGLVWKSDPDANFLREIFDIMKPYIQEQNIAYLADIAAQDKDNKDLSQQVYKILSLPIVEGIICSAPRKRDKLLAMVARETTHITKPN